MRPTKVRLIHRLILRRYDIPPDSVLNRGSSPPVSAGSREIATDLRRIIGTLKVEGFDEAVGRVDYGRLRLSPTYAEYQECAVRLRTFDPASLVDDRHTDRQLDLAARAFINRGGAELDRARGIVRLSRIFQWYAPDFGARPFAL